MRAGGERSVLLASCDSARSAGDGAELGLRDEGVEYFEQGGLVVVPKNLPEQLALDAARDGQGDIIMRDLVDAPRLVANYGEGECVKVRYVLRGVDGNVTVHYFRNLATGMEVEFKFT